jgi:type VI secretion system protein ImpA
MPSPDVLDFDRLFAPIPGDRPTGEDLRENAGPSSLYYKVKDGRSAARAAERQMEGGQEDAPPPDWKAVVASGTKALAESTKDLEIAAYLIEALCRTHGFTGLRDGFKLTRGLVEQYWDGLYPVPDEEGVATKVAPLTGLNGDDSEGTLIAPINRVPITDSPSLGRLTFANYVQATATGRILDAEVREQRIAAGAMHTGMFQKAVADTPAAFFIAAVEDITAALDEFAGLGTALDNAAGHAAPPTSAIRAALQNVLDAIKDIARAKLPSPSATAGAAVPVEAGQADAGRDYGGEGRGERLPAIRNRDDALDALSRLAEYFRRTEPHSLLPYVLEQAVRWGRMPIPDLFAELIPDDQPRKAMFKQVGIRPAEES